MIIIRCVENQSFGTGRERSVANAAHRTPLSELEGLDWYRTPVARVTAALLAVAVGPFLRGGLLGGRAAMLEPLDRSVSLERCFCDWPCDVSTLGWSLSMADDPGSALVLRARRIDRCATLCPRLGSDWCRASRMGWLGGKSKLDPDQSGPVSLWTGKFSRATAGLVGKVEFWRDRAGLAGQHELWRVSNGLCGCDGLEAWRESGGLDGGV